MEEQNIISEITKYVSEEKEKSLEDGVQFERNRILGALEVVKDGNEVIRYELSVDEYNKLTNGDEVGKVDS